MKPNFVVDSDFPVIDGIGHGDKISFFNVKGGGATNTTLLDPLAGSEHYYGCSRSFVGVSSTLSSCRLDPDLGAGSTNAWTVSNPGALNCIPIGDTLGSRGSDKVLLSRVEVCGSVQRPAGSFRQFSSVLESTPPTFPYFPPKCFVALVLDSKADGAVPPDTPFDFAGGYQGAPQQYVSTVPQINPDLCYRYRVLAFDVLEFDAPVNKSQWLPLVTATPDEGGTVPQNLVPDSVATDWDWPAIVRGFRFVVDLNDVLCRFSGPDVADPTTISNLPSVALHVYCLNFDGARNDGFTLSSTAPYSFEYLYCNYFSRLYFADFLSASVFVEAGVDGAVVPDNDVDPMAVLADASAGLGGLPGAPERPSKRTKASQGFFNFRPRSGDAMLFEDDPEFSRAMVKSGRKSRPDRRGFSKYHRGDGFEFADNPGDDFDRPGKRGKY